MFTSHLHDRPGDVANANRDDRFGIEIPKISQAPLHRSPRVRRGRVTPVARHPRDDRLSGIHGTVLTERVGPRHHRNVAIFADGEVDRSPTGSATSARTALLLADGEIAAGDIWRNDSTAGTSFTAQAIDDVAEGVLTEVSGTAFRTGEHR
ncbi:MAG: proline racemase family protein, partial [Solirubrobacterales bacterium]|nr:proline racemase family protein [Solirubrobacterales bacterium]